MEGREERQGAVHAAGAQGGCGGRCTGLGACAPHESCCSDAGWPTAAARAACLRAWPAVSHTRRLQHPANQPPLASVHCAANAILQVVPYLEGQYTVDQFRDDLRAKVGRVLCVASWVTILWSCVVPPGAAWCCLVLSAAKWALGRRRRHRAASVCSEANLQNEAVHASPCPTLRLHLPRTSPLAGQVGG